MDCFRVPGGIGYFFESAVIRSALRHQWGVTHLPVVITIEVVAGEMRAVSAVLGTDGPEWLAFVNSRHPLSAARAAKKGASHVGSRLGNEAGYTASERRLYSVTLRATFTPGYAGLHR